MTAATIYLSLLGAEGLERVAAASSARTQELVAALTHIDGVRPAFCAPRFHEALLRFDRPLGPLIDELARRGIAAGFDASREYPELGDTLLVCATETKTDEDISRYATALGALV